MQSLFIRTKCICFPNGLDNQGSTVFLFRDGKLDNTEWLEMTKVLFTCKDESETDDILQKIFKLLDEQQVI